ncbi:MAG TPA: DUF2254 domain-containing protein, partial [Acidimicrobiia bacterium]|nr:DUF2254 domain-containing protein [Acidimicrobiia bacterium]
MAKPSHTHIESGLRNLSAEHDLHMKRIRRLIAGIRESLYAIPVAVVLLCGILAIVSLFLDAAVGDGAGGWLLGTTVAGGRAIAAAVASATITVSAIVFSITALTTQMASNQYSPRALGEFFEDPLQQFIIGLVVGTFTYSLLMLASLGSAIVDGSAARPSVSATVAIVLGVASALGIVVYINHSLRRMQIDSVVRRIADSAIVALTKQLSRADEPIPSDGGPPEGEPRGIKATAGGWVVALDVESALDALPPSSTCRIDVRLGEAVSVDDTIFTVWPDPGDDWDTTTLKRSVVTAQERSIELDPTFGIRQLVDIALRALSTGVNDPTTAVDVIHHLKTPVRTVLLSDAPVRVFRGLDERRVFLPNTPGRSDYVHAAFAEIRLAARRQPYVLDALMEVLTDLIADLRWLELEDRVGP